MRDSKNPSPLSNPLYTGVSRDLMRDERFFAKSFKKIILYDFLKHTRKKKFVPNQGRFYSQLGNVSFPTWEQFIPKVGINFFQRSRSGTHVQAHLNSASPLSLSKNSTERSYTYCIILNVNAVVLFDFAHDEGALDGADVLDVAKFVENKLLILLHIARAYL